VNTFKNFVLTIATIALSLACGKALNHAIGGLPASLYGLLLFAGILRIGIFNPDHCGAVVPKLIYYMPLVFIPVCVGMMEYLDLLTEIGLKVLVIGVSTTLLGIVVVAWSSQFAFLRADTSPTNQERNDG